MRNGRGRGLGIAAVATLLFAGCSPPQSETTLRTYVTELRRTLDSSPLTPPAFRSERKWYPAAGERRLEVDDVRVGVIDYLPLRACGVDDLVASRNSALGRVMRESSRLAYELRLFARLTQCRERPETPSSLAESLDALIESKRAQLPRVLWNATFGSGEMAAFFSRTAEPLALEGEAMPPELLEALARLSALSRAVDSPPSEVSSSELEASFYRLQSRPFGGEVLASAETLGFYLTDAAMALEGTDGGANACDGGARVFREHYAGTLRPHVARAHQAGRQLLEILARMENGIDVDPPPEVRRYFESDLSLENDNGVWRRFETAVERHARAWQALFDACGQTVVTNG